MRSAATPALNFYFLVSDKWCCNALNSLHREPEPPAVGRRGDLVALNRAKILARSQYIVRDRLRAMTGRPNALWRQDSQDLSAQRAKGKHSFHQALTNYLSNDSPSYSESSSWANLLSLGVLSHRIIPVGLPWR
jgi:hypothetical protein